MADNKQSSIDISTKMVSAGGSIESTSDIGGARLNLTHPSGSNISFGNASTSQFNSGNDQKLTLNDSFDTTNGDKSNFVGGSFENRIEGDYIQFIGPTSLLTNELMDQWFEEYGKGLGSLKSQFEDNRSDLKPEDYPLNTAFLAPASMSSIIVDPPLIDGTAEDNLNAESKEKFMKKMTDPKVIAESEATKALQKELTEKYSNFDKNAKSYFESFEGGRY